MTQYTPPTDQELQEMEDYSAKATEGPWENNAWYSSAVVNDGSDPGWVAPASITIGKCCYCHNEGTLVRVYSEGHKNCHLHRFVRDDSDWHQIYAGDGSCIAGNYDYEEGGISSKAEDAAFIARVRADFPRLLQYVRELKGQVTSLNRERTCIGELVGWKPIMARPLFVYVKQAIESARSEERKRIAQLAEQIIQDKFDRKNMLAAIEQEPTK